MDPQIHTLDLIAADISLLLTPVIAASITFIVILIMKEVLTSIAQGIKFRYNPHFKEGDVVILDGDRAIIIKIGLTQSVFGITKDDETYCWRYIPNTMIDGVRLEKIVNLSNMKLPHRKQKTESSK